MHTQAEQENRLNTEGSDRLAHTLFINCGRALAQAVDEQDLLQSVCNTLVNDCGFRLAWFGYTEPGTQQLYPTRRTSRRSGWIFKRDKRL